MANPRQRRKQRSSTHKAVSHSRHAKRNLKKTKPIRGPKALQEAWDKTKTVRQNYAKLGLVVTLDPSASGGIEKQLGLESTTNKSLEKESTSSSSSSAHVTDRQDVPSGFGRILRDAAGNILGFEVNEPETQEPSVKTLDMEEDLESRMDQDVRQKWSTDFSTSTAPHFGPKDESLVKNLERISATATGSTTLSIPISGVGSRHLSSGEQKYMRPLIAKYGDNVELMTRDLRLNPEQRTAGQLRRALRKLQ